MDRVVPRELEESAGSLFIDSFGDVAVLSLVHLEQTLLHATSRITVWVTMTVVNSSLENTLVPTVDEISMVSIPNGVTVRVYKWLSRVHGLIPHAVEIIRRPVNFNENSRKNNGKVGITA